MSLPRIRKQIVEAHSSSGYAVIIYAYHADAPLIEDTFEQEASPQVVLITASGEPVERHGAGMYCLLNSGDVVASDDPTAP